MSEPLTSVVTTVTRYLTDDGADPARDERTRDVLNRVNSDPTYRDEFVNTCVDALSTYAATQDAWPLPALNGVPAAFVAGNGEVHVEIPLDMGAGALAVLQEARASQELYGEVNVAVYGMVGDEVDLEIRFRRQP